LRDQPVGNYTFEKFCLEPTSFKVRDGAFDDSDNATFLESKLMTRLTYTLDDMSGKITVDR